MRKRSFFHFFCSELLILAEENEKYMYGLVLIRVYLLVSFRINLVLGFINDSGVEGSRDDK